MQTSESASPSSSSFSSTTTNGATLTAKQSGINGHAHMNNNAKTLVFSQQDDGVGGAAAQSESLDKLVEVSVILLCQAIDLVDASLNEDAQLARCSTFIPGSTIGKHLRHATDHFSLLLDSLAATAKSSGNSSQDSNADRNQKLDQRQGESELELSYDVRARGTPMETSRVAARATLERCIARLHELAPGVERDRPVRLTAVTPYVQTFRTSFGRELWFAALHAVHHWSMVRVIAGELGISLDDSFGVAPSTLVHRGSEGPLGRAKI